MKKLLLIIVALVCVTASYAQRYQEAIYLKNGSMIKGTIIEQVPNKTYKIKTSDGSTFVFQWSEVEKITKETPSKSQTTTSNKGRRYQGEVSIGHSYGGDLFYLDHLTHIQTTYGVRFNDYFFAGLSTGFSIDNDDDIYVPITLNVKGYLPISPSCSLFTSFDAGYLYGVSSSVSYIAGDEIVSKAVGICYNKYTISIGTDRYSFDYGYSDFDADFTTIKVSFLF